MWYDIRAAAANAVILRPAGGSRRRDERNTMLIDYLLQNWALILISLAFVISLTVTGFQQKNGKRMYALITSVFLLSIVVFVEFRLADRGGYRTARLILMAVRYSATPMITAQIIYTLREKQKLVVFIPAVVLAVLDIVSIFTGIVFGLAEDGTLLRGPLGYLPFIVAGFYGVSLIYVLYMQSNKLYTEIVPIAFLGLAFASGLILPFIFGKDFAQIFCVTIMIALFVYHVFSILQMYKKDPLTGALNRQAFYDDNEISGGDITALILADMNGLKKVNDTQGHAAGDRALTALAQSFRKAAKNKQAVYRTGGDEFVIVCRRLSGDKVAALVEQIKKNVGETGYSCSVGYSLKGDGGKTIADMMAEADEMMYAEKEKYYTDGRRDRRRGDRRRSGTAADRAVAKGPDGKTENE